MNPEPADAAEHQDAERQAEAVYAYVRTIPLGRVLSYGEVGQAVGVGARAVGWALSFCPPDVPWQRVVGADGYLRIAKRSPHLRALQKQLLENEGVVFDARERVEPRFFLTHDAPGDAAENDSAARQATLEL